MRTSTEKLRDTVLPSPSVLESYESMAHGSVKKLITMSEKEQLNRHRLQKKYFFSYIFGQIFSFTLSAGALYLIHSLAKMGDVVSVMTVTSIYFLIFLFAVIYSSKKKSGSGYSHKSSSRSGGRKPNNRRSSRQTGGRQQTRVNTRSRVVMR